MPGSWMIVFTQLGYLAWRLRGRYGTTRAVVASAVVAALLVPYYETMAAYAGWWRYLPTRLMIGPTPAYVALFEGLLGGGLALLVRGLPVLTWRGVLVRGALLGAWLPLAALIAWLTLAR